MVLAAAGVGLLGEDDGTLDGVTPVPAKGDVVLASVVNPLVSTATVPVPQCRVFLFIEPFQCTCGHKPHCSSLEHALAVRLLGA